MTLGSKFKMGQLVATPGALELGINFQPYLKRHLRGDWGDLSQEDIDSNNTALKEGYRLLSAYQTEKGRIWIITEWDRSVTTIQLPEEY